MYLRSYFAKIACRYYYVSFLPKLKSLWQKKQKTIKIAIVKNNIAIRIDASMNRATPTKCTRAKVQTNTPYYICRPSSVSNNNSISFVLQ